MIIDAEVHFWKYRKITGSPQIRDNKMLQEDYLPSQLSLNLKRNQVDACVATAAEPAEVETRFLSELALTHPIIHGVIGWIDFQDTKAGEKMAELSSHTAIKGYKFYVTGENNSFLHPIMPMLAQYSYTLDLSLSANAATDELNEWIISFPEQIFVLEQCGHPDAKQQPSPEWSRQIRQLSKNKNLYCKVSGLFTLGNWKSWRPADFYPFLDILFESFGADRLLYASDWPFLLLSGAYVQWKSLLEKFTEQMKPKERENFFGENARRLYHL